uniref:Zinc knuckle CX2CX4HX4C domain-containing protein n=1 Tax=Quercus lobata TaxID=97700 RepID=A0A7N2KQY5_QUELO
MDAITTKCANIKLSERERSEVDLAPPGVDQGLVLAGKFYTKRRVNVEAIGRALQSVWRTKRDFEIHGLPTLSQTREAGLSIGGILGKVEKVDVRDKGLNLGCYLRIRVKMDISQPLIRGSLVRMGGLESRWVEFKYECLPVFCYLCGRLHHDVKECIEWIRRAVLIKVEDKQYGPWLRATPDRLQKSHLVMGQQAGERARLGQMGVEMTEGVR